MAISSKNFGPQGEHEREEFSAEDFIFSVQVALHRAMRENGVSQKALADRLGMSAARVSQIFGSGGGNITLRTLSRIAFALGEEFELLKKSKTPSAMQDGVPAMPSASTVNRMLEKRVSGWEDTSPRANVVPFPVAA